MAATNDTATRDALLRPVRLAILGCALGAVLCFGAVWLGGSSDSQLVAPGLILAIWANLLSAVLLVRRWMG